MNRHIRLAVLVVMLGAGVPSAPASACGLEGSPGDSFAAAHPGSLEVAFATQDAINAGTLVSDAALPSALAHDRADERVQSLAAALPMRAHGSSVVVLVVETGTCTRLTPKGGVWVVTEHADGPRPGEVALTASELALRDLAAGRLTFNEAMKLGLLSLHGPDALVGSNDTVTPQQTNTAVSSARGTWLARGGRGSRRQGPITWVSDS